MSIPKVVTVTRNNFTSQNIFKSPLVGGSIRDFLVWMKLDRILGYR